MKKKCFCGHLDVAHRLYVNGVNSKGCRWVCSKDGCHRWSYCDLPNPDAAILASSSASKKRGRKANE